MDMTVALISLQGTWEILYTISYGFLDEQVIMICVARERILEATFTELLDLTKVLLTPIPGSGKLAGPTK